MHVRFATSKDAAPAAEVAFEAYHDNVLHNWLFPQRDRYRSDLYQIFLVRNKISLLEPGNVFTVAVADAEDDFAEPGEVIGAALWRRVGDDATARKWKRDTWMRKLDRYLLTCEAWYQDTFLDRVTEQSRMLYFHSVIADYVKIYHPLNSYWKFDRIVVRPKAQRRGVGTKLLEWGLRTATDEGVPILLESAAAARPLYERVGFREFAEVVVRGTESGYSMLWEPERLRGKWLVIDEKGELKLRGP